MNASRMFVLCIAALMVAGCGDDELGPPPPIGALRFINAVGDTGSMDFRVVDIVGDAPQFLENRFRAATPYQAVQAGNRRVRVFLTPSRSDTIVGAPIVLDTTFNFTAGTNHSFITRGFSRSGQTPPFGALITADAPPTPGAGQIAMRVLNLAPSFAGAAPTLADTTVRPDAFVRRLAAVPAGGTAVASDVGYLGASPYMVVDTGRYWFALTATGSTGPVILLTPVPPGVAGTPAANPIGGSQVSGSVLTAVILPRSVAGSAAPQGGRPAAREVEEITRSNDTVRMKSGSISVLRNRVPSAPDSVVGTTGTGASTGVVASDLVLVTGATEPEYNGWHLVVQVADSLSCLPIDPADTATSCAATNVVATTHFRFRHRIVGAPTSPATGTPVYRLYTPTTVDYTLPSVLFLVDRRPAMTVQ